MGVFSSLLGMAKRSPQGRKIVAADPRKAIKKQRTAADRQVGAWKKLLKR